MIQLPPIWGDIGLLDYIGFRNEAVSAASTSATTGDPESLRNWFPYDPWITFGSDNDKIFEFQLTAEKTIDYFAYLGGVGFLALDFEYYSAGSASWLPAYILGPARPGSVVVQLDSPVTASRFRVRLSAPPVTQTKLSVVAFGELLAIPRQDVGFTPPSLARVVEGYSSISEGGVYLGRSISRTHSEFTIKATFLKSDWAYQYWLEFVKHAERFPFFFLTTQPEIDNAFCWVEEDIGKAEYVACGAVDASIEVKGVPYVL